MAEFRTTIQKFGETILNGHIIKIYSDKIFLMVLIYVLQHSVIGVFISIL